MRVQASYMCYVEGRRQPKIFHPTQAEAATEARRLSKLPENINRSVYVLEVYVSNKIVTKLNTTENKYL